MSEWFFSKDGQQMGPVSPEQLNAELQSGNINPETLIWKDGQGDWLPYSQVMGGNAVAAPVSASGPSAIPNPQAQAVIPNYLWQSIAVTVLCCWPFGIVAIVNAAKVNSLIATNQIAEAQEASAKAKKWTIITLVIGLVVVGAYIAIVAVAGISGGLQ